MEAMVYNPRFCALLKKSRFLTWKTNLVAKLQMNNSWYFKMNLYSYHIFRLVLANLKHLQKLKFLCNWPIIRHLIQQVNLLNLNFFWWIIQNKKNSLAKLSKTGFLFFKNGLTSYYIFWLVVTPWKNFQA